MTVLPTRSRQRPNLFWPQACPHQMWTDLEFKCIVGSLPTCHSLFCDRLLSVLAALHQVRFQQV